MRYTKDTTLMRSLLATMALTLVLAACGAGSEATATTSGATETTTTTVETTSTVGASTADVSVDKANANTATVDEIATALTAAGVDNADRWAREVVEYRPYDTSDPDLTHLREELAKYNPAEGVVDAIVSALEL